MKLRIAAVIAAVVLAVSIGAWLWVGRDGSQTGVAPATGDRAVSSGPSDVAVPRPSGIGASDRPESPATPPRMPTVATSVAPTAGQRSPAPAPRMAGSLPAGRAGSPATSAPAAESSSTATPPSAPPDPAEIAKAAVDVDKVSLMLRDYRTRMGENPFGTNAEIMKAVMGENPKQARLGPPEGQSLNADGELVDRWGTPYFFHQLSKTSMEIRSAGPDRMMWNEDDVIQH